MAPAANHLVKLAQLTNDMQSTQQLKCLSVENMEQVSYCLLWYLTVMCTILDHVYNTIVHMLDSQGIGICSSTRTSV